MNRAILQRQMFNQGGNVKYYGNGGGAGEYTEEEQNASSVVNNILGNILQEMGEEKGAEHIRNLSYGTIENLIGAATSRGGLVAGETMAVQLSNVYGVGDRETSDAFQEITRQFLDKREGSQSTFESDGERYSKSFSDGDMPMITGSGFQRNSNIPQSVLDRMGEGMKPPAGVERIPQSVLDRMGEGMKPPQRLLDSIAKGMAEGGMVDEGIGALMAETPMGVPEGDPASNPAAMEGAMMSAAQDFGALDGAEDYEQAINSVRGDQAPLQARYDELAGFVGPEDAAQTPESVLALVQPVIQMAAIDQGIGSMAPEALGGNAPMTEDMAGGIMSTVPMEGGPPQNFNQGGEIRDTNNQVKNYAIGGPVQYFAEGGAVQYFEPGGAVDADLRAELDKKLNIYQELGLGSDEDRAKSLENQRKMSQSGMLFDIADAALRFAGTPVRTGMSLASTAAESLAESKLFPRISQRADAITEFEQKQFSDKRQLNLAALTSAETSLAAKKAAEARLEENRLNSISEMLLLEKTLGADAENLQTKQEYKASLENQLFLNRKALLEIESNNTFKGLALKAALETRRDRLKNKWNIAASGAAFENEKNLLGLKTIEALKIVDEKFINDINKLGATQEFDVAKLDLTAEYNRTLLRTKAGYDTIARKASQAFDASQAVLKRIFDKDAQLTGIKADTDAVQRAQIVDINAAEFEKELKLELQKRGFEDDAIDREVKRVQQIFDNAQSDETLTLQKAALALETTYKTGQLLLDKEKALLPDYSFQKIDDGKTINLYKVDSKTGASSLVVKTDVVQDPAFMDITIDGTTSTVDINTASGKAMMDRVNPAKGDNVKKVGTTREVVPKAYFSETLNKVVVSYDRGSTYVDENGMRQSLAEIGGTTFPISDEKSYEIYKNSKITVRALEQLGKINTILGQSLTIDGVTPISNEQLNDVLSVQEKIRKGTGFFSKLSAAINAVAGTVMPKTFAKLFKDNTESRQFIRTARITIRAALVNSPRFPVAELAQVEELLANEKNWFGNPASEIGRMQDLANVLLQKKRLINQALADGITDSTIRSEAQQKLFEIDLAEKFLLPLVQINKLATSGTTGLSTDDLNFLKNSIGG